MASADLRRRLQRGLLEVPCFPRSMLHSSLQPLVDAMEAWAIYGQLRDETGEFFIREAQQDPQLSSWCSRGRAGGEEGCLRPDASETDKRSTHYIQAAVQREAACAGGMGSFVETKGKASLSMRTGENALVQPTLRKSRLPLPPLHWLLIIIREGSCGK
ncbi:spc97 spc98 family domain-containing protein [Cyclospora cayetanensis]|uniref:Spc97 spc98 family domain-containing protein n=1 Tax=Cyclospora cayetanensis TaxID=88456 RepID=A0A1D3D248_9EIME|nr:spc97 spc98 family domain-containing protein [Cyclospora cayetanensis]